jgi:phosphoribosylaminoimidazole-succinocarboxamide synthase
MASPTAPVLDGATHVSSGKVRDLYELPDGRLLMVASDRISAFDFILDTTIPDKGEILTRMSLWWFDQLADLVPHHVLSTDVPETVRGRAVICERLEMYPVECVARGYLTGTGLL